MLWFARSFGAGCAFGLPAILACWVTPAPAKAQSVAVWSATLTVGKDTQARESAASYNLDLGCNNGRSEIGNCLSTSVLADDDFTYGSTTYRFTRVTLSRSGSLSLQLDKRFPSSAVC